MWPVSDPAAVSPVSPRYGRRAVVGAAAGGFVLALALGLGLGAAGWWTSSGSDSGPAGGGSAKAVSLPAKLGEYARYQDIDTNKDPRAAANVANTEKQDGASATAISAAYHGAGAAVQTYGDDRIFNIFEVAAVRDSAPDLVVRAEDPAYLGWAVASPRVEHFGEVSCIVSYDFVAKGTPIPANAAHTGECQRTGGGLTVIVTQIGGDLGHEQAKVAALVDQVWDSLQ
jgi:hypothetical protein